MHYLTQKMKVIASHDVDFPGTKVCQGSAIRGVKLVSFSSSGRGDLLNQISVMEKVNM